MLQYGWQEINGNKYYFDEDTGKMQVGWTEVDGKMTFFDGNGKMTSVNSFNDKNNVSDAEIASSVIEKEIEQEVTVNAPSADPLPLPDKLSDVAQTIQEAGSGSQSRKPDQAPRARPHRLRRPARRHRSILMTIIRAKLSAAILLTRRNLR